jgi:hypothetical protein
MSARTNSPGQSNPSARNSTGSNGNGAAAGPSRDGSDRDRFGYISIRERKKQFFDPIDSYATELAEKITKGDSEGLKKLLDFFSSKCVRWSYLNLLGLMLQRPNIQRPVTIREARNLGHYKKKGVTAATILVPHVVELRVDPGQPGKPGTPNSGVEAWRPSKGEEPESPGGLKWDDHPFQKNCVELYLPIGALEIAEKLRSGAFDFNGFEGLVLQVWENSPEKWSWCKKQFPLGIVLESGEADSMAQAQTSALLALNELERAWLKNYTGWAPEHELTDAGVAVQKETEKPEPRKRLFFKPVACVLDLGKDTIGPKLQEEEKADSQRVAKVLEAGKAYAESLGLTIVDRHLTVNTLGNNVPAAVCGNGKLFLSTYVSEAAQAGNLLHELTHWLLHIKPRIEGDMLEGDVVPKQLKELQAEACAYVTARSLGIPRDFSVSYLQSFEVTKKDLMENLKIITATARDLVKGISQFLQENITQEVAQTQPLQRQEFELPKEHEIWSELEKDLQEQPDLDPQLRPAQVIVRTKI